MNLLYSSTLFNVNTSKLIQCRSSKMLHHIWFKESKRWRNYRFKESKRWHNYLL